MRLARRTLLSSAALAATTPSLSRAQTATIRIGVLNDRSGPYRDDGGPTGVICAKQALLDFGASRRGFNVEVLSADHQNKPMWGHRLLANGLIGKGSMRSPMSRPRRLALR